MLGSLPTWLLALDEGAPLRVIYRHALERVRRGPLTAAERATVVLSASVALGCDDCIEEATRLALRSGAPRSEVEPIAHGLAPRDARLRALKAATQMLMERRGRLSDNQRQALDADGIEQTQLLLIVSLVAMQLMSSYAIHLLGNAHDTA